MFWSVHFLFYFEGLFLLFGTFCSYLYIKKKKVLYFLQTARCLFNPRRLVKFSKRRRRSHVVTSEANESMAQIFFETFPDLEPAFDLTLMWPDKLAFRRLMYANSCRGRWAPLELIAVSVGEANRSWKGDGTFGCWKTDVHFGPFWSLIHAGCGKSVDASGRSSQTVLSGLGPPRLPIPRPGPCTPTLWALDGLHADTKWQAWHEARPDMKTGTVCQNQEVIRPRVHLRGSSWKLLTPNNQRLRLFASETAEIMMIMIREDMSYLVSTRPLLQTPLNETSSCNYRR